MGDKDNGWWQPPETAPSHERVIIYYGRDGKVDEKYYGSKYPPVWCAEKEWNDDGVLMWMDLGDPICRDDEILAWMPITELLTDGMEGGQ